jgi:alpha,alpha-trehalase
VLSRYNGTYPATFIESGLQWDAPNTWPPHQYIILEALRNVPDEVADGDYEPPRNGSNSYGAIPRGQLGLTEDQLPVQAKEAGGEYARNGSEADVNIIRGEGGRFAGWVNGGNGSVGATRLGWRDALISGLAKCVFLFLLLKLHADEHCIVDTLLLLCARGTRQEDRFLICCHPYLIISVCRVAKGWTD